MHLIFGLGFPFLFYALHDYVRCALGMTLAWSLGNELVVDFIGHGFIQLDHLSADLLGIAIAGRLLIKLDSCSLAIRRQHS